MGESNRPWLAKAAVIYVDMKRGLYDWGDRKAPRHGDGSYRVLKKQVLEDCSISPQYGGGKQTALIWENPEFLSLVKNEERRRDNSMGDVIGEIEGIKGPLTLMGEKIVSHVVEIFERPPDKEDPLALSPAEYVRLGKEWFHEGLEVEGKLGSEKQKAIGQVLSILSQNQQITDKMVDQALTLVKEHRQLTDRLLEDAVIEGELA